MNENIILQNSAGICFNLNIGNITLEIDLNKGSKYFFPI